MYSTQMNRRYYALEELAEAMWLLGREKGVALADLFRKMTENPCAEPFSYMRDGEKHNLWADSYGISKQGDDKGTAVSLISKYAYFETGYEFPIYDSIVCEMIPLIRRADGKEIRPIVVREKIEKDGKNSWRTVGDKTICNFIRAVKEFCKDYNSALFDRMDRLLWFVGKIRRGNLSLVLTRGEYDEWLKRELSPNGEFDIMGLDLSNLDFIGDPLVSDFFELAQLLGPVEKKQRKAKKKSR